MKVLVFVDHDIICRHFVLSGALSRLAERAQLHFVFPADGRRMTLAPGRLPLGDAPYTRLPINARRQQIWRWRLFSSQLKPSFGRHEAAIRRLRWTTLGWKAALLLTLAGIPPLSWLFGRYTSGQLDRYPAHELEALLDQERPNVVLHPSVLEGPFINDLVQACQQRQIPLVVAMNSWDNPSTKRAVVGWPDYLLVWGEQTRDHAIRFIGMPRESVRPFGAAQFDVLRNPPRLSRGELLTAHGVDPSACVILYAGSNARVDELATLAALDTAVSSGRLPGVAVIYRPHPWGGGGLGGKRFADWRFANVVVDMSMRGYIESLGKGDPGITLPDYRDAHDLLCSVDVVVSPMSTILIEAAMLGKPVIVHAPENEHGRDPLANGLPMLHFAEFLALPEVATVRDDDTLVQAVARLAARDERAYLGGRLQAHVSRRFITQFDQPWRERITDFLLSLGAPKPSVPCQNKATPAGHSEN